MMYTNLVTSGEGRMQGAALRRGLLALVAILLPTFSLAQSVDWGNLQSPAEAFSFVNTETARIYGRAQIAGVTDAFGPTDGLVAELGWGSYQTDPTLWSEWVPASFDRDVNGMDQFVARILEHQRLTYSYCYRYSYQGGPYVYGDLDGSANGLQLDQLGTLTVTNPPGGTVAWCALDRPTSVTTDFGVATAPIYGQVYIKAITEDPGEASQITGQLGWGPWLTDPATWTNWVTAAYSGDAGINGEYDEYAATITEPTAGVYSYCYRFRYKNQEYLLGDLDGSLNGIQFDMLGTLLVMPAVYPPWTPTPTATPPPTATPTATVPPPTPTETPTLTPSPTPTPAQVEQCTLESPLSTKVEEGKPTALIYGLALIGGVTSEDGPTTGLVAEVGWGSPLEDPSLWTNWVQAIFSGDVLGQDQFAASITEPAPGIYAYAYRFALDGGAFCYGDLDGSGNGLQPDQLGLLVVLGGFDTDSDGDGYSDGFEELVGTDPALASSRPTFGDANGDGRVDTIDALLYYRAIRGIISTDGLTLEDLNDDGSIDLNDATRLYRWVNGVPGYRILR